MFISLTDDKAKAVATSIIQSCLSNCLDFANARLSKSNLNKLPYLRPQSFPCLQHIRQNSFATSSCHQLFSQLPPTTFPSHLGRFQWWLFNSSWVCLFLLVLLLASISSLEERNGFLFYIRDPATLTDFFSRFLLFCPFQFFASLLHL